MLCNIGDLVYIRNCHPKSSALGFASAYGFVSNYSIALICSNPHYSKSGVSYEAYVPKIGRITLWVAAAVEKAEDQEIYPL